MSKPRPDMPPFDEDDLLDDPIELFGRWFELAGREAPLPEAVCLATVDAAGQPDARMVLLKGFDERGFRFFTNEGSAKGAQLAAQPGRRARLLLARARPPGPGPRPRSSGSARRSRTSTSPAARARACSAPGRARRARPLADRDELDAPGRRRSRRASATARTCPGRPTGAATGSIPDAIEFWQGQVGRLHDRFRYERDAAPAPHGVGPGSLPEEPAPRL